MTTNEIEITTGISTLIQLNRDAGLSLPRALPRSWDQMSSTEKTTCLWYVRNVLSYFDKAQIARHIIGVEIIANEISPEKHPKVGPVRAQKIWDWVFTRYPSDAPIPEYSELEIPVVESK
jgi:hypothetical protein